MLVDWLGNDYTDPILEAVVAGAAEKDVELVCLVGGIQADDIRRPIRNLTFNLANPGLVDGILVISMGNTVSVDLLEQFARRYDPLPMCSIAVPWSRYPRVDVDDAPGLRAGIEHLVRVHGYRRIAFIRGPSLSQEAEARFKVYRDVLEAHGIAYDPALVTDGHYIQQSGVDAVRTLIDERKTGFEVIVAANDGMAFGALDELKHRGIRVPDDVALFGFDDLEHSRYVRPPLSTVRQPLRDHACAAIDVLFRQMDGHEVPFRTLLPTQLVLRRSCGCMPHVAVSQSLFPVLRSGSNQPPPKDWDVQLAARLQRIGTALGNDSEALGCLSRAFVHDVLDGKNPSFLRLLEDLLEAASARGGEVHDVHRMLVDLRHQARRRLELGSDPWLRADNILNAAGSLVGEVAEGAQVTVRMRLQNSAYELNRTNEQVVTAVDLPSLARVLANELPRHRIGSVYLCAFDAGALPAESARLMLGFDANGPLDLPKGGVRFPCRELLPDGILPEHWRSAYVVYPLLRAEDFTPGYLVFEKGSKDGMVYDSLIDQIGSAYKRILLLEKVVEEARLREVAERERLEKELRIASEIQTGILPRRLEVPGLQIATLMRPATEVGGDYYDIIPVDGGCWIGIGDVAGHGIPAGLVMLMVQSVTGGLVRSDPTASPAALMPFINQILFDNIRQRMRQDEHVTLTLIRYERSGRIVFSGAHEVILVYRAREDRVEEVATAGTWVGVLGDISHAIYEREARLDEGDVMLLYTDGAPEARDRSREMFGLDRLKESFARVGTLPVEEIRDALISDVTAWMTTQEDDITFVVARHCGSSSREATVQ